jgi:Ser/Thr protein kinase RdoA (MazF antagonist)
MAELLSINLRAEESAVISESSIDPSLPSFDRLSPDTIVAAGEAYLGRRLDGVITPFNSYVNRVFGLRDEEGNPFVAKFYRPGRWTEGCLREEHRFVRQCVEAEIPVVPPLSADDPSGPSEVPTLRVAEGITHTLFPLRGGRTFDVASDEDWVRLGAIVARMHLVGEREEAKERSLCSPEHTTTDQVDRLASSGLIPDDLVSDFTGVCTETIELISPLFRGVENIRIHGDCHRGNILDRLEEGLLIIDFDDMMTGPPVQDLWLLLPGHLEECPVESDLLLHGYTQFRDFDRSTLALVEPLRFMRIIYFLSWCALQKDDPGFFSHFPDWGEKGFWLKELEDLSYQRQVIREQLAVGW